MKLSAPLIIGIAIAVWLFFKATKFFIRVVLYLIALGLIYYLVRMFMPDLFSNAIKFIVTLLTPQFKDALT